MQIIFLIFCTVFALNLGPFLHSLATPFRRIEYSLYKDIADYEKYSIKGSELFPEVPDLENIDFVRIKNFKVSLGQGQKDLKVYASSAFVNKLVLKNANSGDYAALMNGLPRGHEVKWRIVNRDHDNRLILEADFKFLKSYERQSNTDSFERNGNKVTDKTVQVSGYFVQGKIIIGGGLRVIDRIDIQQDDPNVPLILETIAENPPTNFRGISYVREEVDDAAESVFYFDPGTKRSLAVTPNLNLLNHMGFNTTEDIFTLPFHKRMDLTLLPEDVDGRRIFEGETVLGKRYQPIGRSSILVYEKPVKIQFTGRIEKTGSLEKVVLLSIHSLDFMNEQNHDVSAAKVFLNQALFFKSA